jgi:hypothetical protein
MLLMKLLNTDQLRNKPEAIVFTRNDPQVLTGKYRRVIRRGLLTMKKYIPITYTVSWYNILHQFKPVV